MDVVKSHLAEVKNNYEGTTQRPFFVNKIPGKCGLGKPLIVKIVKIGKIRQYRTTQNARSTGRST